MPAGGQSVAREGGRIRACFDSRRRVKSWHSKVTSAKKEMQMRLKPLGDRIVIRQIEAEDVTASGIVLPDTAQEKPQRGEVLAVGEGRYDDGVRVPLDLVVGDEVIYSKYGGTEVEIDGEDLLIIRESDVLAKADK